MQSTNGSDWTERTVLIGRVITGAAVIATALSLVLVERINTTYQDGLDVTEESAQLVVDSVGPVKTLADDLSDLAAELATALEGTRRVVATTATTLETVGVASTTNLADIADSAAAVSDDLASVLETIERFIPGDTRSAAEELRLFADGLEPVADQLRDIGEQLQAGALQLEDADQTIADIATGVADVATSIQGLDPAFDELEITAEQLVVRAADASDRVGLDRWLFRLVFVLIGAVLALTGIAVERVARRLDDTAPSLP